MPSPGRSSRSPQTLAPRPARPYPARSLKPSHSLASSLQKPVAIRFHYAIHFSNLRSRFPPCCWIRCLKHRLCTSARGSNSLDSGHLSKFIASYFPKWKCLEVSAPVLAVTPKEHRRPELCSETRLYPLLSGETLLFVELDYSSPADGANRWTVMLFAAQIAVE